MMRFPQRLYVLDGHTPRPVDAAVDWTRWFMTADRQVADTQIEAAVRVSTVFLGLDYQWDPQGPPLLFETICFGLEEEYTRRYSTWDEAAQGHVEVCAALLRGRPPQP